MATNARILDAAQKVFSEFGFEQSQLAQVAERAGCSRGAIYAQYASKEDVFLALIEHRIHTRFAAMYTEVQQEPRVGNRLAIMRQWIIDQVCDPSWGTLTLEFKLYAMRRPESKATLLKLYDDLFIGFTPKLPELLFGGKLSGPEKKALERRLVVLGGAVSGMVLEGQFRSALLPPKHLQELVGEVFDNLIHL